MFTYPWWRAAGDKFLEHGHRLAGIAIGIASLFLCAALAWKERRTWVKVLGAVVLLAVILQGLLGGLSGPPQCGRSGAHSRQRGGHGVCADRRCGRRDEPRVAANLPSPAHPFPSPGCRFLRWQPRCAFSRNTFWAAFSVTRGCCCMSHLGFAFVAALMLIWLAMSVAASGIPWLRGPAAILAVLTICQLALGAGAWFTKFGFGGEVAVRDRHPRWPHRAYTL